MRRFVGDSELPRENHFANFRQLEFEEVVVGDLEKMCQLDLDLLEVVQDYRLRLAVRVEVGMEVEVEEVGVDNLFVEDFDNLGQGVEVDAMNSLVANHRLENRIDSWEVVDRFDNLNLVGHQFEGNLRRKWFR